MAEASVFKCPLVAAIDFGTTYSGYAFSFRHKPQDIQMNHCWVAGSNRLISLKTPTCLLVNPDKGFDSFGYEAENKFASLAEDRLHGRWYFFRNFKMQLHNNKTLSREKTIDDISGNSMPAMDIISMSLKYLKDHLLKALENQVSGILESHIQYMLTIPAIWDDDAKQFMREAAEKADIATERLKMALEPEAASIWCQTITTEAQMSLDATGTQYMVVDLGGGTADISVHEKKADGTLKGLHKASGGAWGGIAVDKNYIQMLNNLFGESVMERFKNEQMEDYFDMLRDFETKKRTISSKTEGKVTFRLSASLTKMYEENGEKVKDAIVSSGLENKVTLCDDKLRIDASEVKNWFSTPINSLIAHVKDILAEPKMRNVGTIVLVGGFGESQLVQDTFRSKVKNKRLVIPNEAGLAVLNGAVQFGHNPDVVSSRIVKCSYGVDMLLAFNPVIHPKSQMVVLNGEQLCEHIFGSFVTVGDEVNVGQEIEKAYTPIHMSRSCLIFYSSEDANTSYTTEPTCKRLGELVIDHPEGKTLQEKVFDVKYILGDTELFVKVKMRKTGRKIYKRIDCLKKSRNIFLDNSQIQPINASTVFAEFLHPCCVS